MRIKCEMKRWIFIISAMTSAAAWSGEPVDVLPSPPAVEAGSDGEWALDFQQANRVELAAGFPEVGAEYALTDRGLKPFQLSGGTGSGVLVGVDARAAAAAADREGWPWWGKALVIGGCVVVAGLATWAVVEACDGGSSHREDTWDASQTISVDVGGTGNAVTVNYHSPALTTGGGEEW